MNRFPVPQSLPRRGLLAIAVVVFAVGAGLSVPSYAATPKTLVGLGDSFTSGVGSGPYVSGTVQDGCLRSNNSYVVKAAQSIGGKASNLACSGAETSAFTKSFKSDQAQIDQLKNVQSKDSVEFVAMTVGGNDVLDFDSLLRHFANPDRPFTAGPDNDLLPHLSAAYVAALKAAPKADVFVVGYPNVIPSSQSTWSKCSKLGSAAFSAADAKQAIDGVNKVSKSAILAVSDKRLHYVSVDFTGHEVCSADPWVNPITLKTGSAQGSLHPNAKGQAAIAKALTAAIAKEDPQVASAQKAAEKKEAAEKAAEKKEAAEKAAAEKAADKKEAAEKAADNKEAAEKAAEKKEAAEKAAAEKKEAAEKAAADKKAAAEEAAAEEEDADDSSTTSSSTTTSSTTSSQVPVVVSDDTELVPVASGAIVSTSTTTTTRVAEEPEVLGEQVTADEDAGEAETANEAVDNTPDADAEDSEEELAYTGTDLAGKVALGLLLLGVGLGLMWIRLVHNDRLALR